MEDSDEFKKFLEENSHDKPKTFFGAWAWYEAKKREFQEKVNEDSTVGRTDRQD